MINVITEFVNKTTVRIIAYIYNDAGALTDPISAKVTIYDPDGEKQLLDPPDNYDIAMTKNTDEDSPAYGAYEYYYETDADTDKGWWRGEVEVIDGTPTEYTSMGNFSFRIK